MALKTFEDLDYYCSDNIPVSLLPEFVRSVLGRRDESSPRGIHRPRGSRIHRNAIIEARRLHRARAQRVAADVVGGIIHRDLARHGDDRMFGGAIGDHATVILHTRV